MTWPEVAAVAIGAVAFLGFVWLMTQGAVHVQAERPSGYRRRELPPPPPVIDTTWSVTVTTTTEVPVEGPAKVEQKSDESPPLN